jgi:hypothetical protein
MIELRQPLQVENKNDGACVILWLCEPFDRKFSFRVPIVEIREILGGSASTTIELPPEESGEDFVDGRLIWGARTFQVHFERSLGYLQLSSSADDVNALRDALASQTYVGRGDS